MSLSVLLAVAFVGAALYYICPLRFRWVLLLLLSYGFYLTCGVSALPFILITTLTTWAGALKIGRIGESGKAYLHEHKAELTAEEKKARKAKTRSAQRIWFFAVLLLNFGVLAVLKYLNPVMAWGASLTGKNAPALGLVLPLGISFYTFQSMGYLIDVYNAKYAPERTRRSLRCSSPSSRSSFKARSRALTSLKASWLSRTALIWITSSAGCC